QVVVAKGVVELRLADPDEAVCRVEEERAPDEEDLRRKEHLPRECADPAHQALEALSAGEDEAVLEEDVNDQVGADREDAGRGVKSPEQKLSLRASGRRLGAGHNAHGIANGRPAQK